MKKKLGDIDIKFNKYILFLILFVIIFICFFPFTKKITHLGYEENVETDSVLNISDSSRTTTQEVKMPFELFSGIGIKIGTHGRDNNSTWNITFSDKKTGKKIYSWEENASVFKDNQYHFFRTKKDISVKSGDIYIVSIESKNVKVGTSLAFYKDSKSNSLGVQIYGDDYNSFWMKLSISFAIILAFLITYIIYLVKNNKNYKRNIIVESMVLGIAIFSIMFIFARSNHVFSDETDNIAAGYLMMRGKVFYRDYVSQHPPTAMILSAFYALIGAKSVEQFRILHYLFLTICWVYIYIRHHNKFGKFLIVLIALLQTGMVFITFQGYFFLADSVSGISMTILFLEYLKYTEEKKITLISAMTLSFAIFFSFGSNFLMIYPIFIIFMGYLISEIIIIKNHKKLNINWFLKRYIKAVAIILLPFLLILIYFYYNHALTDMIDQIYKFNIEIYPNYIGFGQNKLIPIIDSLNRFITILPNSISNIVKGENIINNTITIFVYILFIRSIISLYKKKELLIATTVLLFVILMLVRNIVALHAIGFWNVFITTLCLSHNLFNKEIKIKKYNINYRYIFIIIVFLASNLFISNFASILYSKKSPISSTEHFVVHNTDEGEMIFQDYYVVNPIYLIYKDRLPVNRATYLLPWYMDWYEEWVVEDLKNNNPKIALFKKDQNVWDLENFYVLLKEEIENNYTQIDENSLIWIRNE